MPPGVSAREKRGEEKERGREGRIGVRCGRVEKGKRRERKGGEGKGE